MTTERNAFGMSLFAGNMLVSLPEFPAAVKAGGKATVQGECKAPLFTADMDHADADQRQDHEQARSNAHRRQHVHHIRGGNP